MKYRLNHWKDFPLSSPFIFGQALSHGPFIRLSNWYWIHIWGPFTIIGTTTHIASTNIGRKESYLVAHLFWNLDISARFICYIGGVRGCKAIPSWIQVDRISRLGDLKSTPNIWGSVGHVTGGVESYWKKEVKKKLDTSSDQISGCKPNVLLEKLLPCLSHHWRLIWCNPT